MKTIDVAIAGVFVLVSARQAEGHVLTTLVLYGSLLLDRNPLFVKRSAERLPPAVAAGAEVEARQVVAAVVPAVRVGHVDSAPRATWPWATTGVARERWPGTASFLRSFLTNERNRLTKRRAVNSLFGKKDADDEFRAGRNRGNLDVLPDLGGVESPSATVRERELSGTQFALAGKEVDAHHGIFVDPIEPKVAYLAIGVRGLQANRHLHRAATHPVPLRDEDRRHRVARPESGTRSAELNGDDHGDHAKDQEEF